MDRLKLDRINGNQDNSIITLLEIFNTPLKTPQKTGEITSQLVSGDLHSPNAKPKKDIMKKITDQSPIKNRHKVNPPPTH